MTDHIQTCLIASIYDGVVYAKAVDGVIDGRGPYPAGQYKGAPVEVPVAAFADRAALSRAYAFYRRGDAVGLTLEEVGYATP